MPWLLTSFMPSYFVDLRRFHIIGRTRLVIHYPSFVNMQCGMMIGHLIWQLGVAIILNQCRRFSLQVPASSHGSLLGESLSPYACSHGSWLGESLSAYACSHGSWLGYALGIVFL